MHQHTVRLFSVLAQTLAMVRGDDEQGVCQIDTGQQLRQLRVHRSDLRVIRVRDLATPRLGRLPRHVRVVEMHPR